jgi:hypothetical protein
VHKINAIFIISKQKRFHQLFLIACLGSKRFHQLLMIVCLGNKRCGERRFTPVAGSKPGEAR